jgi:hypothetical protein
MDGTWLTDLADELARCLVDAERCAASCEELLATARSASDSALQKVVVEAVVPPAAIARVLIELIDQPPRLVLAACRLCRESAQAAARELDDLVADLDCAETVAALRAAARSCERLLDAAQVS